MNAKTRNMRCKPAKVIIGMSHTDMLVRFARGEYLRGIGWMSPNNCRIHSTQDWNDDA